MVDRPYIYLISCTDGTYDFMASDVRLNPYRYPGELIREIPDEDNNMRPVESVELLFPPRPTKKVRRT